MNKLLKLFTLGSSSLALLSIASYAQDDDVEDVFELSPFIVDSSEQDGYTATSTLAGTRLKTKVEDIASAISIYTEEFAEDLGATNANELLIFTPGIEAGGSQGNIGIGGYDSSSARVNPQNGIRTRGLAAPSLTRGFFVTDIAFDSYNTTAVTVNRGANGILFGIGSPAGIVDGSLKQASLYQDSYELTSRIGDNKSFRTSLDINKVLIKDKLAARISLLYDEERYDQQPAFDIDERVFATFTYKPTESTTIRANYESGEIYANRPLSILPSKGYSQFWLDAGMPTNNWQFWDDPALNPDAASQVASRERDNGLIGQRNFFLRPGIVYNDGHALGAGPDFGLMGVVQQNSTSAGRVRPGLFHPTMNRDSASDTYQWLATRNLNTVAASYFPGGVKPVGIVEQGFTTYDEFAWNEKLFDETSRQLNDFEAFNIAAEQLFLDGKFGIEGVYDYQSYESDGQMAFATNGGSANIRIDVNEILPDGKPNPNVGRPYVLNASGTQRRDSIERNTYRLTAFFKHDFTENDGFTKWLGRHTVTGLYERNEIDNLNWATRFTSNFQADSALSSSFQSGSRTPTPIVYLGPSILDGSPVSLNSIRIAPFQDGTSVSTTYFAAENGNAAQGDLKNYDLVAQEYTREGQYTNEIIESTAVVLQSYWLNDHVITTFGWREDTSEASAVAVPTTEGKTVWTFNDFDLSSVTAREDSGKPSSMGIVVKWPEKFISLPAGMNLSFFYNESDNFTPAGTRVNPYGQSLGSPSGETKDYGVNLSLNDGQFNLRMNFFETSSKNNSYHPGNPLNRAIRDGSIMLSQFWANDLNAVDENGNPAPIDRRGDFQLIVDALPEGTMDAWSWSGFQQDAEGLWMAEHTPPGGFTDTQDFTAEGMELELTYNPTKNWTILANVARQETVRTNVAPWTQDLIERLTPVWNQIANDPRGAYPIGFRPGDTLPAGTETVSDYIFENVTVPMVGVLANEGLPNSQQREWRFNLVSNYKFTDGILNGSNLGVAYRWQDEVGIGFPFLQDSNGVVTADTANPYTAPAESNIDLFIGYGRKIWNDKIDWRIQLNFKNIFGSEDPIVVQAQYDGTPATVRVPPEKRWYITNTFSF